MQPSAFFIPLLSDLKTGWIIDSVKFPEGKTRGLSSKIISCSPQIYRVTHNREMASKADRIIRLVDGKITDQ
jgi:hypothetical protein